MPVSDGCHEATDQDQHKRLTDVEQAELLALRATAEDGEVLVDIENSVSTR